MANIKLLNLEKPSAFSELSNEATGNITGGARRLYRFVRPATTRRRALQIAVAEYQNQRRRGVSRRRALAASLGDA